VIAEAREWRGKATSGSSEKGGMGVVLEIMPSCISCCELIIQLALTALSASCFFTFV
jgi:hypothetical protein